MGHWFLHQPHTARRGGEVFARGERGGCGSQYSDGSLIGLRGRLLIPGIALLWTGERPPVTPQANYFWPIIPGCGRELGVPRHLNCFQLGFVRLRGIVLEVGSSITYLWRSVKRTVSGSSLGWVSESRIPMSSASLQVKLVFQVSAFRSFVVRCSLFASSTSLSFIHR